jgi:hypothetical protein
MARRICSAFLSAILLQGAIAAEIDPDSVNVPVTKTKGTLVHLVVPIRWSNHHDRLLPGLGQLNTVLNNNGMWLVECGYHVARLAHIAFWSSLTSKWMFVTCRINDATVPQSKWRPG